MGESKEALSGFVVTHKKNRKYLRWTAKKAGVPEA